MRLHKLLCIILSVLIFLSPFCFSTSYARANEPPAYEMAFINDTTFYKDIIESEANYIKSLMLSNGALPKTIASVTNEFDTKDLPDINGITDEVYKTWDVGLVVPYFSELAILGLLNASPDNSQETVRRFIEWYFKNLNTKEDDLFGVDGTIYDYYVFQNPSNPEQIVQITTRDIYMDEYENPVLNPHCYDSSDSYAALFLRILYEYSNIYEDNDIIESNKTEIDRVLNALFATYDYDLNLTYAKKDYQVYYLMDNCEVYYGLIGASKLYSDVLSDTQKANELNEFAEKIKVAIEDYFWDEETGYIPGIFKDETPINDTNNFEFYPNATAQLYPIVYGLVDSNSERAEEIYYRFNNEYGVEGKEGHDWAALDKGDDFPWCLIANAAVRVGDYERTDKFFTLLETKFLQTHTYPYYNAEAGQALIAASLMLEPKELLGVTEEIITAAINEEIDLGLILYPEFSDPGKTDVQIKDDNIAKFDKNTGKLKTLSAGQTNINIAVGDNTFMVVLNVTGDGSVTQSDLLSESSNQNENALTYGLIIALIIIGIATIFVVYLYHTDKKKNNES